MCNNLLNNYVVSRGQSGVGYSCNCYIIIGERNRIVCVYRCYYIYDRIISDNMSWNGNRNMWIMGSNWQYYSTICYDIGKLTIKIFIYFVQNVINKRIFFQAEYTSPIVPMGLFFLSLLIGGCLSFTLPETVNKILPNTLAEADEMWRVKK